MEIRKLAPKIVMCNEINTSIIAKTDRDIIFKAGLRAFDDAVHNHLCCAAGIITECHNRRVEQSIGNCGGDETDNESRI